MNLPIGYKKKKSISNMILYLDIDHAPKKEESCALVNQSKISELKTAQGKNPNIYLPETVEGY